MLYDLNGNIVCDCPNVEVFTDAQCSSAFLRLMAKKASLLGMSGTYYASASGLTTSSYSTPQDELKIGVAVAAYSAALDVWSHPDASFAVRGDNARTLSVVNNVISGSATDFAPYYKTLGGKGGSLTMSGYDRAQVRIAEVEGIPVLLSLMARGQTPYNNIFKSAKELCDMMKAKLTGGTPTAGTNLTALVNGGGGYAAIPVPNIPAAYCNLVSPSELLTRTNAISDNATVQRVPASTSKIMTMLLTLEYVRNPHKTELTLHSGDIEGGSGSTFYAGDILTVQDALYIMMMESSNTLAQALGRLVGGIYLNSGEEVSA